MSAIFRRIVLATIRLEGRHCFQKPTLEFSYKNDALGDPYQHFSYLRYESCQPPELALIREYSFKINDLLKAALLECGITLVDLKLEFGKTPDGTIILADEISPDTCRFWDAKTGEKLDKDRFRRDLGNVEGAYQEITRRLLG